MSWPLPFMSLEVKVYGWMCERGRWAFAPSCVLVLLLSQADRHLCGVVVAGLVVRYKRIENSAWKQREKNCRTFVWIFKHENLLLYCIKYLKWYMYSIRTHFQLQVYCMMQDVAITVNTWHILNNTKTWRKFWIKKPFLSTSIYWAKQKISSFLSTLQKKQLTL